MITLFTPEEFKKAKSKDLLWLQCEQCAKQFQRFKGDIKRVNEYGKVSQKACRYCSTKCQYKAQITLQEVKCSNCNKLFKKRPERAFFVADVE